MVSRISPRQPLHVAGFLIAAAVLLSCGGDSPTGNLTGIPARFDIVSGDAQSATVNTALANPIVVKALDASGNIVANAVVNFVVTVGGGSVFASAVQTNAGGIAQNVWTMGTLAGAQTVEVRAINSAGLPVTYGTFHATATPGAAESLSKISGDAQTGVAGAAVTDSFVVKAVDHFGNGVPGVVVTWTMASGGGSVSPSTYTTLSAAGSVGLAKAKPTLGTTAGVNTATASATGLTSVSFSATGTAGGATTVTVVAGDNQTAAVATTLPVQLKAKVADANGNAVAGVAVTWSVSATGGSLAGAQTTSDASGFATATWTLGTVAGTRTVTAQFGSAGTATFHATATPGAASAIAKVSGDAQSGSAGAALAAALVVQVADQYGNLVSGSTVTWSAAAGNGSLAPGSSTTDANGRTQSIWTLGGVGSNSATASIAGGISTVFTATAGVAAGTTLSIISGDGVTRTASLSTVASPIVVKLADAVGVGVSGASITFAVTVGTATLSSATAVTDGSGQASSGFFGTVAGPVEITASTPGVTPVVFHESIVHGQFTFLRPVDLPATAPAGSTVDFHVTYIDAFGNPVPNLGPITLTPTPNTIVDLSTCGSGHADAADASGNATAQWTLCPYPTLQTAEYANHAQLSIEGTGAPLTFYLARKFSPSIGFSTQAIVATDATGRVAPGITVTYTLSGSTVSGMTVHGFAMGSLIPTSSTCGAPCSGSGNTNRNGQTSVDWRLDVTPGTITVTAPGYAPMTLTPF